MYMNKRRYTPDCNRCNTDCTGRRKNENQDCKEHTFPKERFMLAELALAQPTNLNKALSALPFESNLHFYLK